MNCITCAKKGLFLSSCCIVCIACSFLPLCSDKRWSNESIMHSEIQFFYCSNSMLYSLFIYLMLCLKCKGLRYSCSCKNVSNFRMEFLPKLKTSIDNCSWSESQLKLFKDLCCHPRPFHVFFWLKHYIWCPGFWRSAF